MSRRAALLRAHARWLAAALLAGLGAAAPVPAQTPFLELDTPFVTTPDNVVSAMLELGRVGPSDYLIDLGSGDGRIVIAAARSRGARGLGVEIDPRLVERSRESAARAGVSGRARFVVQDLFDTDLSAASVITMYLLPDVNLALRPRLLALAPGTRIVSHDWGLGDWEPDERVEVAAPRKTTGIEKVSRLYFWVVPARVEGAWSGRGNAADLALEVEQRHQRLRGQARVGGTRYRIAEGRVRGVETTLALEPETGPARAVRFIGRLEQGRLAGRLEGGEAGSREVTLERAGP